MSEPKHNITPYKRLGFRLKKLRETSHQSLAEVSGAVEIEPENLASIENGEYRPSEDVLLLLISHFDPKEDEAVRIWELAGYDERPTTADESANTKPIIMMVQPDNRVIYSDAVNVVGGPQGFVINFLQTQGKGEALAISRVGMSREQAFKVFEAIGQSLQSKTSEPRLLPSPRDSVDD
ncbi:MAG: helix-turn-helix transcriptional regulator [Candidatus Saccharimonadales bacterium]